MAKSICLLLLVACLGCAAEKRLRSPARAPASAETLKWSVVETPAPAADIAAVGKVFWICGADEMIASSSDGGNTWKTRHFQRGGETLLHIAFVNQKVGHANGNDALLLSSTDGGKNWIVRHRRDSIVAFSFADANNGIALFGDEPDINRFEPPIYWDEVAGEVRVTHDGGGHWEDIPIVKSDEFKSFHRTIAVAALDPLDYLALVGNAMVVTTNGGKTWKVVHQRDDATNRDSAKRVFIHDREYWAFGTELLDRQHGGGGIESMTRHSRDGETWSPGISAASDMAPCNSEGCYLHDGIVETLYGTRAQFWILPQDGTLSSKWAIAGNRACTIETVFECGPAVMTEQAPSRPPRRFAGEVGRPHVITQFRFAKDCIDCGVKVIRLDPGRNWQGKVEASFELAQDGSVQIVWVEGAPVGPLGSLMQEQLKHWKFQSSTTSSFQERRIPIAVKCVDAAELPTADGCELRPGT